MNADIGGGNGDDQGQFPPAGRERQRRLSAQGRAGLLACLLLLGGCSGPQATRPAPVQSGGAQVHAYQPSGPAFAPMARPQPARAVQALLDRAAAQRRAGNYSAAAVSLERGLRIEPANPMLWNRLAHLDAAQGHFGRVEQLAAKSNSLAGGDAALIADNWRLIAQARQALGDPRGAQRARERANLTP